MNSSEEVLSPSKFVGLQSQQLLAQNQQLLVQSQQLLVQGLFALIQQWARGLDSGGA